MSGETEAIAEMANRVAKDVFKWFRWERAPFKNLNFEEMML